jgi:hypothetical protein
METRYSEAGGGNDITIHDRKSNESSTRACTLALVLRVRRDICRDKRDTGATVHGAPHHARHARHAVCRSAGLSVGGLVPGTGRCGVR